MAPGRHRVLVMALGSFIRRVRDFQDETRRIVEVPVMTEHMPVQGNQIAIPEIGEEVLKVLVLVEDDEFIAVEERHPVVIRSAIIETMPIGFELLGGRDSSDRRARPTTGER